MNITDNWERLEKHGITPELIKKHGLVEYRNKEGYLKGFQAPAHNKLSFFSTTDEVLDFIKDKREVINRPFETRGRGAKNGNKRDWYKV